VVDWIIEPFGKQHDRDGFSSGQPALDEFIRHRVSQYEKRRLGKTFVAVQPGATRVIGFYTLAAGALEFEQLPDLSTRLLPRHPVPVVRLARLAVDRSVQGQRLGEGLLLDALQKTLDLSANLGVHAVAVDAIDETAAAFHRKYGFTALRDRPLQLYLPIAVIDKLIG